MSAMVVIKCPETDEEVPIGVLMDLHTFACLPTQSVELSCPACGQVHAWSKKDAYLSLRHGGRESRPPE
jgi:endogenous inhibitor of DNA gyrase (YacG/DUF329 family)